MKRNPEDITLGATAGGVMLATSAAVVLIIYAMLRVVDLLPSSLSTQDLVRLVY